MRIEIKKGVSANNNKNTIATPLDKIIPNKDKK